MSAPTWMPGPWHVENGIKGAYVICNDAGYSLCSRARWPHRATESDANARLIAAAPDLAAVCDELVKSIRDDKSIVKSDGYESDDTVWLLERAEAALAKARG